MLVDLNQQRNKNWNTMENETMYVKISLLWQTLFTAMHSHVIKRISFVTYTPSGSMLLQFRVCFFSFCVILYGKVSLPQPAHRGFFNCCHEGDLLVLCNLDLSDPCVLNHPVFFEAVLWSGRKRFLGICRQFFKHAVFGTNFRFSGWFEKRFRTSEHQLSSLFANLN